MLIALEIFINSLLFPPLFISEVNEKHLLLPFHYSLENFKICKLEFEINAKACMATNICQCHGSKTKTWSGYYIIYIF